MSLNAHVSRRSLFVAGASAAALAALPQAGSTQVLGEYSFEPIDGHGFVLADVRVVGFDLGDGDYMVKITVVPTADEIEALMQGGFEHVNFEVTFLRLEEAGRHATFTVGENHELRHIGERIHAPFGDPMTEVLGVNLNRMRSGVPAIVTAMVHGYQPSRRSPRFSVDLVRAKWWSADGSRKPDFTRERVGATDSFFTESGSRSRLVDSYGDTRFPFQR